MSEFETKRALLAAGLAAAVPLKIAEYRAKGGPDDADRERARQIGQELGEKGDRLMFRSKPGETAEMFNKLADGIAILAFCPGGIVVLGEHFEAKI